MKNPPKTFTFIRLYSHKKMAYIDYRKHPTRRGYVTRQKFEGDGRDWGQVGRKSVIKSTTASKEIRKLEATGLWKITRTNPNASGFRYMHNETKFGRFQIIQSGTEVYIPDLDYHESFNRMQDAEDFLLAVAWGAEYEFKENRIKPKAAALMTALDNVEQNMDHYFIDSGKPLRNPGKVIRPGTDYFARAARLRDVQKELLERTGRWIPVDQIEDFLWACLTKKLRERIRIVK